MTGVLGAPPTLGSVTLYGAVDVVVGAAVAGRFVVHGPSSR